MAYAFVDGYEFNTSSDMELPHWDCNSSKFINYTTTMPDRVEASMRGTLTSKIIMDKMNQTAFHPYVIIDISYSASPGNVLAFIVYLTKMKRHNASYFIMALTFSDLINCISRSQWKPQ